jgi:hypothetical protein
VANTSIKRCAIYTRKSSEEGLEQDYNSLHAQREACEAFIKSQAGEGWRLIRTAYDDGGFSGARDRTNHPCRGSNDAHRPGDDCARAGAVRHR